MPNSKGNGEEKKKKMEVKLVPSLQPKLGRIYSNYIELSHSPWDFTMRFCDAPSGGDVPRLQKDGKIEVPNLIDIIIPINIMPDLIKILQGQLEKYNKSFVKEKE